MKYKGLIYDFENELGSKEDVLISYFQGVQNGARRGISQSIGNLKRLPAPVKGIYGEAVQSRLKLMLDTLNDVLILTQDKENKKRYYFIMAEQFSKNLEFDAPGFGKIKLLKRFGKAAIEGKRQLCEKIEIPESELNITPKLEDGEFIELPE